MNRETVKKKVLEVVNKTFNRDTATEDTELVLAWGGTSLDEMEITMQLEEYFKIDLYKDAGLKRMETPRQLIDLIISEKDD